MKKVVFTVIIVVFLLSLQAHNENLQGLLNQIQIQSIQYKGSSEHQTINSQKIDRDYQIGSEKTFWRWNLSVMPPTWIQAQATCRAVGEHCYLFVANDQWNVHMNQANVDSIMAYLETKTMNDNTQGAIAMDTLLFGPIPDELDNDPKLIVFYSALGSFQGSQFDGYFSGYNQVTEAEAQQMNPPGHSNECEMIYMTCYPLPPAEPIRISVLAHELQHLIHWGMDPDEENWVNEGCSELAMVKFGLPDPITNFPTSPDNSLIAWNNQFADYVKVQLFFTYLYEHYGQDEFIHALVSNPGNGITGIDTTFPEVPPTPIFNNVFINWGIANYLHDTEIMSGQYGYELLDLPAFAHCAAHSMTMEAIQGTQSLHAWAVDYIKLIPSQNTASQLFMFNIPEESNLHHVLILFDENGDFASIEEPQNGGYAFFTGAMHQKIIWCVFNDSDQDKTYNYNVFPETANTDLVAADLNQIKLYPNPVSAGNHSLKLNLQGYINQNLTAALFNIKGQKITQTTLTKTREKDNFLSFETKQLSSGIYFVKLSTDNQTRMMKLIIMK